MAAGEKIETRSCIVCFREENSKASAALEIASSGPDDAQLAGLQHGFVLRRLKTPERSSAKKTPTPPLCEVRRDGSVHLSISNPAANQTIAPSARSNATTSSNPGYPSSSPVAPTRRPENSSTKSTGADNESPTPSKAPSHAASLAVRFHTNREKQDFPRAIVRDNNHPTQRSQKSYKALSCCGTEVRRIRSPIDSRRK